jgi:hypothetical protein
MKFNLFLKIYKQKLAGIKNWYNFTFYRKFAGNDQSPKLLVFL